MLSPGRSRTFPSTRRLSTPTARSRSSSTPTSSLSSRGSTSFSRGPLLPSPRPTPTPSVSVQTLLSTWILTPTVRKPQRTRSRCSSMPTRLSSTRSHALSCSSLPSSCATQPQSPYATLSSSSPARNVASMALPSTFSSAVPTGTTAGRWTGLPSATAASLVSRTSLGRSPHSSPLSVLSWLSPLHTLSTSSTGTAQKPTGSSTTEKKSPLAVPQAWQASLMP